MKKIKVNFDLIKIFVSILLFILSIFFDGNIKMVLLIMSYIIISYEIYIDAFSHIKDGDIFDENLLMIIATIGALVLGNNEEAVMVMLLFEIGEHLSDLAVDNSKKQITKLMDLRSDSVNILIDDNIVNIPCGYAKVGDKFVVKVGEKIPLDGEVIDGSSYLDTKSLTGEATPRSVRPGDLVLSGCINNGSLITVKASKTYETSTAFKIIDMIENSNEKKTETEKFITKFSRVYTPIVILCALLLTIIPVLFGSSIKTWGYRSLVFLVTSCPCALVISVPLSYFCGIGRASREKILIKGSSELDKLGKLKCVVFDKTGTITEGNFSVSGVFPNEIDSDKLLEIAAFAEYYSNHPIAKSIIDYYKKDIDKKRIKNYKEISGYGVEVLIDDCKYFVGNDKLMEINNIDYEKASKIGTVVYISKDSEYLGYIIISDKIKKSSYKIVSSLRDVGVNDVVMLSGDNLDSVKDVSSEIGITDYYGELLPLDKVNKVKSIKKKGLMAFVGDGINDALVIKISDLGIAMGQIGSDAAIEASDVVIMRDDLLKIPEAIKISKLTNKILKYNIFLALSVKFIVLLLAVFGISTIWMAVFADVGITLITILNSLLIMKIK